MNNFLNTRAAMIVAGVLAAGVVLLVLTRKSGAAIVDAINPASSNNIVNRAVESAGDVLDNGSADNSFSVGSRVFDFFNPEFDPNAPVSAADLAVLDQIRSRNRGPL